MSISWQLVILYSSSFSRLYSVWEANVEINKSSKSKTARHFRHNYERDEENFEVDHCYSLIRKFQRAINSEGVRVRRYSDKMWSWIKCKNSIRCRIHSPNTKIKMWSALATGKLYGIYTARIPYPLSVSLYVLCTITYARLQPWSTI